MNLQSSQFFLFKKWQATPFDQLSHKKLQNTMCWMYDKKTLQIKNSSLPAKGTPLQQFIFYLQEEDSLSTEGKMAALKVSLVERCRCVRILHKIKTHKLRFLRARVFNVSFHEESRKQCAHLLKGHSICTMEWIKVHRILLHQSKCECTAT